MHEELPTPGRPERRRSLRHEAADPRAWLGWREGRRMRVGPAVLLDLGRCGAAVAVPGPVAFAAGAAAWLCLEPDPVPTEAAEARVVGVEVLAAGLTRVRLAFAVPCPPALFQAGTGGPASLLALIN